MSHELTARPPLCLRKEGVKTIKYFKISPQAIAFFEVGCPKGITAGNPMSHELTPPEDHPY